MSEMSLHFRHESRTDVIKGCNLSYTRHYISNYNRPEDDELIIDGNTDIVEMIEKAVNEHDNLVARAEKAEVEVELLRQYIRENGYCGYHGTKYNDVYPDCTRCYDGEHCERYRIIIKDGEADD